MNDVTVKLDDFKDASTEDERYKSRLVITLQITSLKRSNRAPSDAESLTQSRKIHAGLFPCLARKGGGIGTSAITWVPQSAGSTPLNLGANVDFWSTATADVISFQRAFKRTRYLIL